MFQKTITLTIIVYILIMIVFNRWNGQVNNIHQLILMMLASIVATASLIWTGLVYVKTEKKKVSERYLKTYVDTIEQLIAILINKNSSNGDKFAAILTSHDIFHQLGPLINEEEHALAAETRFQLLRVYLNEFCSKLNIFDYLPQLDSTKVKPFDVIKNRTDFYACANGLSSEWFKYTSIEFERNGDNQINSYGVIGLSGFQSLSVLLTCHPLKLINNVSCLEHFEELEHCETFEVPYWSPNLLFTQPALLAHLLLSSTFSARCEESKVLPTLRVYDRNGTWVNVNDGFHYHVPEKLSIQRYLLSMSD
ncbi:hypothetical protein HUO09_08690 [Vibrio sp. Y2-5]|uniref:hypothetical protein n=1 Tax=Vibrio sp. Y2-5 TaxID=2743977 RepID=UPI001660B2B6|nr:hypothetical protein [Vibrio sp. Y2-5]MBD0786423.1 hypothetical protein [Vibrio sp. Y2-5]